MTRPPPAPATAASATTPATAPEPAAASHRAPGPGPSADAKRLVAFVAAAALSLWAVWRVLQTGQVALAATLLVVLSLAAWTYGSSRSGALRYLFPGIAAALVFVVFPMIFTIGIGFTNRSSTNLLDHDTARAVLLGESTVVEDTRRDLHLLTDGKQLRLGVGGTPAAPQRTSAPFDATILTPDAGAAHPVLDTRDDALPPGWRALSIRERIELAPTLEAWPHVRDEQGRVLEPISLREAAQRRSLYEARDDGTLVDRVTGKRWRAHAETGFYVADDAAAGGGGERLQPGFQVNVGWQHYRAIFTDARFREPFVGVFLWTVAFAALSVAGAAALGMLLASLLGWDRLRGRHVYRVILFLPYAVPGFLSILIFKGLFNQNLGEVNLILNALFGVKPEWFSNPWLARVMLLVVNIWLGFPYMMVICTGLLQSLPGELREASAEMGAGPWTHFRRITLPLVAKPLMPLLIAAFAFNFNNFVLVTLLTGGRPDLTETVLPAGTTDILVSYTWRIAFNDSGQQYGMAAAISTVIFVLVALITLAQMRATRVAEGAKQEAR